MRHIMTAAASLTAIALTGPAIAQDRNGAAAETAARAQANSTAVMTRVLADARRDDDKARDQYRHPAETLAFFQVGPNQTVVEYGPGGGWYTRVLAPYLADNGRYLAVNGDTGTRTYNDAAQEERAKSWPMRFPAAAAEWTGLDAATLTAFESDEAPDDLKGQIDRVLIFRSLHGMMNANTADSELRAIHAMLKDDGMVGVVQHRAKADQPYSMTNGSRGYLRESDVVNLFALHGFELADSSDVNANPADTADWDGGVWTLPPVLRYGDVDRARYVGIGETDRMTLLFRKRS